MPQLIRSAPVQPEIALHAWPGTVGCDIYALTASTSPSASTLTTDSPVRAVAARMTARS
ncbi:hypothetical protein [Streptomyces sp. NPDC052036]|uniref:hypothetical protein n=1 Tax=unclassified Streptomyces TaxID=2593676 RepID=UPI00342B3A80